MNNRCRWRLQELEERRFTYLLETGRLAPAPRGNALLWKTRKDEWTIGESIAQLDERYPHLAVVTRETWHCPIVDEPTVDWRTDVQALAESLMARGVVMGGEAA